MRRSIVLATLVAIALVSAGAGATEDATSAGDGLSQAFVVTPARIGPLSLGRATPAGVTAWAGKPTKVWSSSSPGGAPPPVLFSGVLWEYRCGPDRGYATCRTLFGFRGGRLTTFSTQASTGRTQRGTRVGTPLRTVIRTEPGRWNGFGFQCPGYELAAPPGRVFMAQVGGRTLDRSKVTRFYLGLTAASKVAFDACGS